MVEQVSEERRREVFAALVAAQDDGVQVASSRSKVALDFGLSVEQVVAVEAEGMKAGWPPLGD